MASFSDWLGWLKSARKGPVTLYASRGRDYVGVITLDADYTDSTMRGEVRLLPDAAGAPLEEFAIGAPVIGADPVTTTFTIALSAGQVDDLPAANAGDGLAEFAFDLLLTPDGGVEELLFGGTLSVGGRITE